MLSCAKEGFLPPFGAPGLQRAGRIRSGCRKLETGEAFANAVPMKTVLVHLLILT